MRACAVTAIFRCDGFSQRAATGRLQCHGQARPEFQLTPFYEADLDFAGKKPGDVIKREAIPAPAGAVAWRVMYVSRTWDDRLVPVTGIIVAPKEPGHSDRPIITWEHGTTGTARVSAPSLAPNPAQELVERSATAPIDYGVPYLNDFLKRGFVVVATDYYGLGRTRGASVLRWRHLRPQRPRHRPRSPQPAGRGRRQRGHHLAGPKAATPRCSRLRNSRVMPAN